MRRPRWSTPQANSSRGGDLLPVLTELVEIPGGSFRMGSTSFYPEEAPIHTVTVGSFAIERHPVTNAQFAEFVTETGYLTVAERPWTRRCIPVWRRPICCPAR